MTGDRAGDLTIIVVDDEPAWVKALGAIAQSGELASTTWNRFVTQLPTGTVTFLFTDIRARRSFS